MPRSTVHLSIVSSSPAPAAGSTTTTVSRGESGTAALSAPGTLYATLAGRSRAASLLLPLLYFPLIIPALVGAVKATELAFFGDPMNQWSGWVGLLGAFSMVFWALCGALSSAILEDG